MSKYKYIVTYNSVDTEVFPCFDGEPLIKYESKGDEIALLKKFDAKLIFKNQPTLGITDYDYFLGIETNDKCALLQLDVQQLCAGTYTSVITAEFGVVDGDWDKDNCTFSVEPNPNGLYACLLSGTKVNIVDVPQTITTMFAPVTSVPINYNLAKFEDVLLYVAQQSCPSVNSIVSDFFQINPVNVSSINYVTGTENVYVKMGMTALSNVRSPNPTEQATVEMTTFKELMDDLFVLFNVYWAIDISGDIRIEHFNYWNAVPGLDLTQARYDKYLAGTNKYKYNRKDSPRYENWTMNNSPYEGQITYDNACGNNKLNEDRITYSCKKIYTDFYTAYFQPQKLSGSTPGIFLFAYHIVSGANVMLGTDENAELVLPRLVLKFHRFGRPQLNGSFQFIPAHKEQSDYGDLFIYSEKPIKEQKEIQIPFCCSDSFDPGQLVTTFMGINGVVANAVQNLKQDTLKLSLKYKLNTDNTDTTPDLISGLQVWYDGSLGKTIVAGKVFQWDDQSGNGHHLIQPTPAERPTDGGDHLIFNVASMFSTNAFQTFPSKRGSVFIVSKTSSINPPTNDQSFLALDSPNKWDISLKYDITGYKYYSFSESLFYTTFGFYLNTFVFPNSYAWTDYLFMFELIRDNDTTQKFWLNGKPAFANPMTIANTQVDNTILYVGAPDVVSAGYKGSIYEIIIYDRDLNDIERQKVEQYLAKKYELNMYSVS